jgi:hypothetical protein
MGNKVIANIREDYGRLYVKTVDGEFATLEEMHDMINRLIDTYKDMVNGDLSQETLYTSDIDKYTRKAMGEARIEYPFSHPFAVYNGEGKYRGTKQPRFSGVYIVTLAQAHGMVKIGFSNDLYVRSKGLRHEVRNQYRIEDPVIEPLAFIHTNNHSRVEQTLHKYFAEENIGGEWFHREPVEKWLEQFRSAS